MLARWLLLCCCGLSCCLALNPDRLISQYHKRHWQIEDGLPQNSVNVILEGPDGYLIVATTEGLARFDGVRFTPFDLGPATDLSSRWVTAILASRNGGYWFGTQDNGVYLWNKNQVTHYPVDRQAVQGLMEDGSGAFWLGTGSAILYGSQGNPQPIKGLPRAPSNAWNVFAQDRSGTVWIVTIDGLHRFQKGAITTLLRSGPPHGAILSVVPDDSGELWIGTSTGLFRLHNSGQGANLVPVPGVAGPVARVLKDRHGTLWVGTWGKGLYRVTSRGVDFWTSKDGLPDDFIRTLFEDREGNLWIGTRSGGLSRWKDTAIVPFGIPEGFGGNFASAICEDPQGNVWLGTWRSGLYRLQDGEFLRQPTPNPTLDFTVRAMASDLQGNIWIGNWEGLYRFDGKSYLSYSADQGFPHVPVSALAFDRRGSLWLGTAGQGLLRFDKADPSGEAAQTYFPLQTITALLEDSQGRIWAGTSKGVARISGSALDFFGAEQGLAGAVTSISEDSRQRIWISTKSGSLALAGKDGIYVFDKRHGLPGHALYRLLDDHAGSLWISSARGILRLTLADVDEVLAHRKQRLDPILYDKDDGLRSIEFHGLSQPSGWRAREGNLWFPTVRGFVRISPAEGIKLPPLKVLIEEISAGGKSVTSQPDLKLAPGTHDLEIRFTALRFASPEQLRFRYKMEGSDPEWVERGERTARYASLSPGSHRFQVSARDANGRWSEPATEIEINQLPRFYQTLWFSLLLAAGFIALGVLLYRWRVLVIRGRYAAVLAERSRIAHEWHDTLLAGFSAISWQLDETLSRLKEMPERASETVEVARKMVHHYRGEARRVIWDLREDKPESESLSDAISSALRELLQGRDIQWAVVVKGEQASLPEDLERNVLRICQEASTNALRHGQPGRIDVRLEYSADTLKASIQDDGTGFEPSRFVGVPSSHFGLAVMRERARRFGGQLRLESQPGNGTIVEASIPLGSIKAG
jgi:ligand-binding sensor domain-containing protein/signal transduction histidine kinase